MTLRSKKEISIYVTFYMVIIKWGGFGVFWGGFLYAFNGICIYHLSHLFLYLCLIWAVSVLNTGVCCLDKTSKKSSTKNKKEREKKTIFYLYYLCLTQKLIFIWIGTNWRGHKQYNEIPVACRMVWTIQLCHNSEDLLEQFILL